MVASLGASDPEAWVPSSDLKIGSEADMRIASSAVLVQTQKTLTMEVEPYFFLIGKNRYNFISISHRKTTTRYGKPTFMHILKPSTPGPSEMPEQRGTTWYKNNHISKADQSLYLCTSSCKISLLSVTPPSYFQTTIPNPPTPTFCFLNRQRVFS